MTNNVKIYSNKNMITFYLFIALFFPFQYLDTNSKIKGKNRKHKEKKKSNLAMGLKIQLIV